MEYRVLARKYRPQNFSDLIGQDVLVRTLTNAFASNRVAHAFILTGIRGVGKTTTARIIARALNCIGPDGQGSMTIEPCGTCTHCTMIAQGRHMDVLEMDAASHTGVDDIRDLIGTVQYLPSSARTKVYIIDEVHMLSNNAFNALLKTLEEPPPHVKFIFATTEIRKIPVTILSRCQRFDLKRIETEMLARHLAGIGEKEAVASEPEALTLIANAAEGSVRDSLSLFDQAIAHSAEEGGVVRTQTVRDMLGMHDKSQLFVLLETLFSGKITESLQEFRRIYEAGADPAMIVQDMLGLVHFVTRVKLVPDSADDVTFSEQEREFARKLAQNLPMSALTKAWQMLLKGLQEVRLAPDAASAAEMILIRIAYSADLPSPTDLIRSLKKQQDGHAAAPGHSAPRSPAPVSLITTQQAVQAPEFQPTPETAFEPVPQSFTAMVELFRQKREAIAHNYLMRHVHLIRFEKGRIELNMDAEVPVDFAGRIGKALSEWTNERWVVSLSREPGEATLQQQEDASEAALCAAAADEPLVRAALAIFPGAEIVKVIESQS